MLPVGRRKVNVTLIINLDILGRDDQTNVICVDTQNSSKFIRLALWPSYSIISQ